MLDSNALWGHMAAKMLHLPTVSLMTTFLPSPAQFLKVSPRDHDQPGGRLAVGQLAPSRLPQSSFPPRTVAVRGHGQDSHSGLGDSAQRGRAASAVAQRFDPTQNSQQEPGKSSGVLVGLDVAHPLRSGDAGSDQFLQGLERLAGQCRDGRIVRCELGGALGEQAASFAIPWDQLINVVLVSLSAALRMTILRSRQARLTPRARRCAKAMLAGCAGI